MKVFNLCCTQGHRFEGWFSAAEDFDSQSERGLIECPVCGSQSVSKIPSAPHLNLSGARSSENQPDPAGEASAAWMNLAREIIRRTEDVGDRFADEARKIHYRETPHRGIRGHASAEQARELSEEGIEVFSFPIPKIMKEPVQ